MGLFLLKLKPTEILIEVKRIDKVKSNNRCFAGFSLLEIIFALNFYVFSANSNLMSLAYGEHLQKCGDLPNCELSGWSLANYVLFCHAFWWISYCFLILMTKQSEEWCCRLLTFAHGCIISFTAIRDIIVNKRDISFRNDPLSESQKNYLSFMLSYFLFDFCWFHFFGNEPWVIYFHHITSILIILKILMTNYGGGGISYAVAGLEFTNPYLQMRWFLRTHGYLNTRIHSVVELWFFCLFSLIRTFGGSILFYYAAVLSDMDLGMKLSFLCIYIISLVLQWQIISYFRKKYSPGQRRNVNFTSSRVSISQYFQRKTLDRPIRTTSSADASEANENETSKKKEDSLAITPETPDSAIILNSRANSDEMSVKALQSPPKKSNDEETFSIQDGSEKKIEIQTPPKRSSAEENSSIIDGNERQHLDE